MKQVTVDIYDGSSEILDIGNIIISAVATYSNRAILAVGSPGLPNVKEELYTGDTVLFETPSDGVFEVRVLENTSSNVICLVSQISPRLGIAGGFTEIQQENTPFSNTEIEKISSSIKELKQHLSNEKDFSKSQVKHIDVKLNEIFDASKRMGRKDWMNYVAGSLTSLCITAAFDAKLTKTIFTSTNSVFRWLFDNALLLIQ